MLQLPVSSLDQSSDFQIELVNGFGVCRIRTRLKACSASIANDVFAQQFDRNLQWSATRWATARKPNRFRHNGD